ncbi:MAG: hypothetical protein FWH08_05020 [Oscillospiraceae bacterium]|nr:hypothetical protein [Oscillospiraceae bacterium]
MTFRESYKKAVEQVRPDESLIEKTLEKMNTEVYNPESFIKRIPVTRFAMAAAGVCIVIAAAIIIPTVLRDSELIEFDASREYSTLDFIVGNADNSAELENDFFEEDFSVGESYSDDIVTFDDFTDDIAPDAESPISASGIAPPTALERSETAEFNEEADFDMAASNDENYGDAGADDWSGFLSFSSYKDWPDAALWDNITVETPVRQTVHLPENEIPPQRGDDEPWNPLEPTVTTPSVNLPEIAGYDIAVAEESFDDGDSVDIYAPHTPQREYTNFSEFAEVYLNQEHRLYGAQFDTADDIMVTRSWVGFKEADTRPLFSLLAKYTYREVSVRESTTGLYAVGVISLSISTNEHYLELYFTPSSELVILVTSAGENITMKLDNGDYEKLLAYLMSIE